MKKLVTVFIIMAVLATPGFLTGCMTLLPQSTSVCDSINDGESLICEIAKVRNTTPEEIGLKLILVDYAGIRAGLYTPEQAIAVLRQASGVLDTTISYKGFKYWILGTVADMPELVEISQIFPSSPLIMYKADRAMIKTWIDRHVSNLEAMVE